MKRAHKRSAAVPLRWKTFWITVTVLSP